MSQVLSHTKHQAAAAAYKQKLIAEGELYRVGIVHARANVVHALHPQSLLHGAVEHALGYAHARVDAVLAPGGLGWQALVPYVLPTLTFIARKKIFKPALGVGIVVVAALAWFGRRRKRAQQY